PRTWSYEYGWFTDTTQASSIITTAPVVSTTENGSGLPDMSYVVLDTRGRPTWTQDAAGYINYTQYQEGPGAVVKTITDVTTLLTNDFQNLPDGWRTPAGGGLHLVSRFGVDDLGRPVISIDPQGNATYTVYNDIQHEVRTYRGWIGYLGIPTGPTEVLRDDWANGYTESLTMTAQPTLTVWRTPAGTEAVNNVQTLSRSYVNAVGQPAYQDRYVSFVGITYSTAPNIGTLNTNYFRTQFGFDAGGRQDRVATANGTIYRTLYDGLGRAASQWVGTSDI